MADVASAVRSFLVADAGVAALVSTRIYTDIMPQDATLPAVSFSKTSTRHDKTLSTFAGLAHCRLNFDCYASTRLVANSVAEAIRVSGLVGTKGMTHSVDIRGVRLEEGQRNEVEYARDDSDDHRYVTSFDFEIDYTETI